MLHETLTLLDARGLLLRDFHGSDYKSAETAAGAPCATWQEGLVQFLERTLIPVLSSGVPATSTIACWDAGNAYRTNLFSGYKAKRRAKAHDEVVTKTLRELRDAATRLMGYLGICSVHVPGEEADDLIALLAQRVSAAHVIVRTKDEDLLQLVSPRVSVWLDREFFSAEMPNAGRTIGPELTVAYKMLVGDSSDEYGGVPQFGEKAFLALLESYGADGILQLQDLVERNDLQGLQAIAQASGDARLKRIAEHWAQARLCLALAKLDPRVCYGMADGRRPKRPVWYVRIPSREKVLEILTSIGMPRAIVHFEHLFPQALAVIPGMEERLPQIARDIVASPIVAWDYETTDKLKHQAFHEAKKSANATSGYVDVLSQELAGVSINYGKYAENTVYLPFDHAGGANFDKAWMAWLLRVFDARAQRTVVQNAAFEMTVSQVNLGAMPRAPFDTAIMASYADENEESGLKAMSLRVLGYTQQTYKEVTQGRDMNQLSVEEVLQYGCDDSLVTAHLYRHFRTVMECEGSWEFYAANEVDPVVNDTLDFISGQDIDYALMDRYRSESLDDIAKATARLRELLEAQAGSLDAETARERASELHREWMTTVRVQYANDPDKLAKKNQELWERAWAACFYEPATVRVETPEFVATPALLNKVLQTIDPQAPKLLKANGPGVEDFDSRLMHYLGTVRTAREAPLREFAARLFSARRKLAATARSGPEYAALVEFCRRSLGDSVGKRVEAGDQLCVNSTSQMQGLLYGKLGLPVRRRSKVSKGSLRDTASLPGAPGTGLKAIAAAFVYDLPEGDDWRKEALLAYKTIVLEQQNQSLYYRSYPLWAHPRDQRIHPQIRNCGTKTRRPAGNDPNVLQVSKKEGGKLRRVFRAGDYDDGPRVVVSADFANQELVITACEARDPVMLDAFLSEPRKDLHSLTSTGYAHILLPRLGIPWASGPLDYAQFMAGRHGELTVPGVERETLAGAFNQIRNKYSKACNFLIAYMGGYTTLAENLLIPKELAKELMDSTFRLYPRLKAWQEETIEFARVHGYTQTAYGNRRHATSNLYSADDSLRTREERQLTNATIQGTAADILKEVRQRIFERSMRERYRMRAVKYVYDETTASVPQDLAVDYCLELVETMSIVPPGYPVGMAVEVSIGTTWGNQVEAKGLSRPAIEEALEKAVSLSE